MLTLASTKADYWKGSEFGPIPHDWQVLEAFDFQPFITSGSRGWAQCYSEYGFPFIRITNLSNDNIYPDRTDLRFVDIDSENAEAARTALKLGDVLVSITADIGAIGYVDYNVPLPAYINQHIACLRLPSKEIDSRYVAYFLASEGSQRRFRSMLDVGAKSGLNLTAIGSLKLLLPPLGEQRAIAEALSDADALIESLEALIVKKRAIKQGATQDLLSGRKRLPGFSGEWVEKRIGELAETDPENLSSATAPEYSFNYIALEDVHQGTLLSSSERVFGSAPSRARRRLRNGDILFGTVRPNLMSHYQFSHSSGEWVCSTGFCVLRCLPRKADPSFIFNHLFADHITTHIEMLISGSNYPAVNSRDVAGLEIPCPDYEEQLAISALLSEMREEIDLLEAQLAKARQIKQGMMQELLTGRVRLV